jgi:GT2 family glycosyltransferase
MDEDKQTAFAGSVILDYYKPELIQCCGVKYFKYLGISKLILKNENWDKIDKSKIPIDEIDFQHGASLLVRLDLLDKIGLMDERFFLYSEEHDWQYTAEEMGYKNVLAKESLVYHKGSMGTSTKKHLFFYYYNRSAMLFAKKHSNAFIVFLVIFTITGITIVRTKFYLKSLLWGMKGLMEGLLKY